MMEDVSRIKSHLAETIGEEAPEGRLRCLVRSLGVPGQTLICLARIFAGVGHTHERPEAADSTATCASEERAVKTYAHWATWRDELLAYGKRPGVQELLSAMRATGFCTFYGTNRLGMPCCWLRPALHRVEKDHDATALLYYELTEEGNTLADKASAHLGGGGPFCVVYDRQGLSFWQARQNAAQCRSIISRHYLMAETLVDMFYNRVGVAYVVNSGLAFWACWRFAQPFLLPEVRKRLVVLRGLPELETYIAREEMPPQWRLLLEEQKPMSTPLTADFA